MTRPRTRLESSREGVSAFVWFLRGVRRDAGYYVLIVLRAVVQALPERVAYALFQFLADLAFVTVGRHRRRAVDHLQTAFPDMSAARARWMAKRMTRHLARNVVEFIRFPLYSRERLLSMIEIPRKDLVDRLANRGALALSAHLGNWEFLAAAIAVFGYPISVVARRVYYEKFDRLLRGTREAAGVCVIDRDDPKGILRALRNGRFVGLLADMDIVKLDSVYVDFFGRLALTPTGPVALALRTGAPLFPAFIVRNDRGGHTVLVNEPLDLVRTGDPQKDLLLNTMRAAKAIERVIRQHPDQWMWMHRRWQHQPDWEFLKKSL